MPEIRANKFINTKKYVKKTATDGLVKSSCATSRLGCYRFRFKGSLLNLAKSFGLKQRTLGNPMKHESGKLRLYFRKILLAVVWRIYYKEVNKVN